jgi:hypothetical protein
MGGSDSLLTTHHSLLFGIWNLPIWKLAYERHTDEGGVPVNRIPEPGFLLTSE